MFIYNNNNSSHTDSTVYKSKSKNTKNIKRSPYAKVSTHKKKQQQRKKLTRKNIEFLKSLGLKIK